MAWSRRRFRRYGRYRRRFRRFSFRRRRYRRFRRDKTKSSVVKLTREATFGFQQTTAGSSQWLPYAFTPTTIPGFNEYLSVYTHFRILKCVLRVATQSASTAPNQSAVYNYLTVPSRPFATTQPAVPAAEPDDPIQYVPAQDEDALRQARFQRVRYPNLTTQMIKVPFKAYTLMASYGPSTEAGSVWQRTMSASRWMPITWALPSAGVESHLTFFGPYVARSRSDGTDGATGWAPGTTLEVYFQFRGQI